MPRHAMVGNDMRRRDEMRHAMEGGAGGGREEGAGGGRRDGRREEGAGRGGRDGRRKEEGGAGGRQQEELRGPLSGERCARGVSESARRRRLAAINSGIGTPDSNQSPR